MRSSKEHSYWFQAKTYGIGWALPVTWQGWLVVLVFCATLFGGLAVIETTGFQLVYSVTVGLILVAVVAWKGEKPLRWRWGRKR